MIEIKHPLKEQFLVVIENGILLFLFKPKDLWIRFVGAPDSLKWQTYSLIKQLVKFGYLKKVYDQLGNQYYSETDRLSDFRVIPPFLIELMGRKSKALLLFKNRWTTIY